MENNERDFYSESEIKEVEYEQTMYYLPVFSELKDDTKKTREKMEKSFRNVIVSFQDNDPIINFNMYKKGPLISVDTDPKHKNPYLYVDENDNLMLTRNKLYIKDFYCPICGAKINMKPGFNIVEFFENDIDTNPYFNMKYIDKNNISFIYISCKHCLQNIEDNYKEYGKPLFNDNLFKLYERYGTALGFECDKEINKHSRCLYPIDRILFKYKDDYIYLNLFNLADFFINKFSSFATKMGLSEDEIDSLEDKIISNISYNILDENDPKFEIYRQFNNIIKEDAKNSFYKNKFNLIKAQFNTFKLDTDVAEYCNRDNDISGIDFVCKKQCSGCNKILNFKTKDELYKVIQTRKDFNSCKAKDYLKEETLQSSEEINKNIENEIKTEDLNNDLPNEHPDENIEKLIEDSNVFIPTYDDDIEIVNFNNEQNIEKDKEIDEEKNIKNEENLIENAMEQINEINNTYNEVLQETVDKYENESIKSLIIQYFYPSKDDLYRMRNKLSDRLGIDADKIDKNLVLNEYADVKAEELFYECNNSGKECLNKYPGITFHKLKEFIFDLRIYQDKKKQEKSKKEQDARLANSDIEILNKDYSFIGEQVEDQNMDYLNKSKEKNAKENKKKQVTSNYKSIFNTPVNNNSKRVIPFIMESAITEIFDKSAFKTVFDKVFKFEGYKAGNNVITINEASGMVPIVDFPDVGVRFVCIDTTDINNDAFRLKPVNFSNGVPFPNQEFRKTFSLNILYSNECMTKPNEVAWHIYKIVNFKFIPKERHVLLSNKNYPLAYTTEVNALIDFDKFHSIFSDKGRVKNNQVTLIAFAENDPNDTGTMLLQREKNAKSLMDVFNFNRYNSLTDLLYNYTMYYVAAAHYTARKLWNKVKDPVTGKEYAEPYILYTITQYTENKFCVVADGLPAIVSAILKEHDKTFAGQNMQCAIVYEYDMTALVSPSVRQLLLNTEGIFNVDSSSYGQPLNDCVTSYIIVENRFKTAPTDFRDDYARSDYRWFESAPDTFRKFLGGKIRKDENIEDRHNLLVSLGYVPYPTPKPFAYNITQYALKQLEESDLMQTLFEIKLSQLGEIGQSDAYKRMVSELYASKIMAQQNVDNTEEVGFVSEIIKHAYRIFVAAKDQVNNK